MVKYWLWLQSALGFASNKTDEILSKYESPKELYDNLKDADKVLKTLTPRDFSKLKNTSFSVANRIIEDCYRCEIGILTPDMDEYPKCLFNIYGTPIVLYTVGDVSLLKTPIAATVVGTREPTKYATRVAYKLSYDLAKVGVTIVSGCALGVDSWAHGGALDAGGKTIAVAGTGLDVDYPKHNFQLRQKIAREGLIISEFPPRTKPEKGNFPYRNRVMAALSCGTIVVQAPRISGSLITARNAVEQGKDVYIVPDSIFCEASAGGLEFLKECGYPITSALDFINNYISEYSEYLVISALPTKTTYSPSKAVQELEEKTVTEKKPTVNKKPPQKLNTVVPSDMSGTALSVYNLLKSEKLTADEISRKLSLPINVVLITLTELEIENLIRFIGGATFTAQDESEIQ